MLLGNEDSPGTYYEGIGTLVHFKTYVFYDRPLLYSAIAETPLRKEFFVVVSADETERSEIWLISRIPETTIEEAEDGDVSARSLFTYLGESLWKVEIDRSTGEKTVTEVDWRSLPEDWLPASEVPLFLLGEEHE